MSGSVALFVYGTLRDPALVQELTGKSFLTEEAWLLDYRRYAWRHTYPFVRPSPGSRVRGKILKDVDARSLAALDRYECVGTLYDRVLAQAETRSGIVQVFVYVARPGILPVRNEPASNRS
ncbi:MAG: hypothetical protein KatS3mg077_0438 [Candidatus Binatia bacterium]|nr:MAG: hypothetical protein KatS3mg077_0438 [Candidatus Binatia bacterium]